MMTLMNETGQADSPVIKRADRAERELRHGTRRRLAAFLAWSLLGATLIGVLASYWNPCWIARSGSVKIALSSGCLVVSTSVEPHSFYLPMNGSAHYLLAWESGFFVRRFQGWSTDWLPALESEFDRSGRLTARHLRLPFWMVGAIGVAALLRRHIGSTSSMGRSRVQVRSHGIASEDAATKVVVALLVLAASAPAVPPTPPKVDQRWAVTVNGQTIRVDADGRFRLPNISAADLFGASGPGSPPDFRSDEWFQVVGTATIDGVTWYAYSEPFQIVANPITGGQTYSVLTLPVTRRVPTDIPESIAIEVVTPLQDDTLYIGGVGGPGSTPIHVWANFAGLAAPRDVTTGGGTTYRTSNRRVVDVEEAGGQVIVTARGIGTAFVTATNRGATAVQRFVVTTPCLDTLLVGRVFDSGGSPVSGAIVSTEGGSNAPTGTNAGGEFSFNVCYTPGTPFSVVVVSPAAGQKAVITDIMPVPDGVTDIGTIILESNLVFWNVKQSGDWNMASKWHTNSAPTAASHVFINIEDRLQPPFPDPSYSVTLNVNATVTDFTLDSPRAIFRMPGGFQVQFNVTGESRLISGLVVCRDGLWRGGTLINDTNFDVYGSCYLGDSFTDGLDVVNNGRITIRYVSGSGPQPLFLDGATNFTHASTDDELTIDGQLHVQRGASFTTTPTAKGITVGAQGFLRVGNNSPNASFTMNGGALTIRNCTPLTAGGVRIANHGTFVLNDGLIDIKGFGDDPLGEFCGMPNPPQSGMRGALEVTGLGTMTMNGGVVENAGVLKIGSGATFNFDGGTIVGNGSDGHGTIVENASLILGPNGTSLAPFTLRGGNSTLQGQVRSGQTIVIQGATGSNEAHTRAIPDAGNQFTNDGTIRLESIEPSPNSSGAEFKVDNSGTLVNNGTIDAVPGTGGFRVLNASLLENYGTITLSGPTTFTASSSNGVFRNRGTLTVASGGTLTTGGSSHFFEQLAGTLSVVDDVAFQFPRFTFIGGAIQQGTVAVLNGTVALSSSATGRGHFTTWGGCTLEGEIGPSHTVVVEGSNRGGGGATLVTPSGQTLTNRGALIIATPDAGFGVSISLIEGQQLVNEVGATFDVNAGAGTNPFIGAVLRNKGVTNLRRALTLGNNNAAHQNQTTGVFNLLNNALVTFQGNAATPFTNAADAQSSGVVAGVGQLNVGSGRTFQNGGRVKPGGDATAGTLTVTGNYTQTSGGTLDIELGGTGAGQFDKLVVTQQATLAGTMNVTLLPGYTPVVGHTFDVVTYATRSGTFTTINGLNLGNGLMLQAQYTTTLRLTVVNALSKRPSPDGKPAARRPVRR